jgi:hypothetical protein
MPLEVARALRLSTLGFIPCSMRGAAVTRVFLAPGIEVPEHGKRRWSGWGAIGQVRAAQSADIADFHAGGQGHVRRSRQPDADHTGRARTLAEATHCNCESGDRVPA